MEREKAYPDAYRLARKFHNLYEETAPKFGYETRGDTKEFDAKSPNGRTMVYVCKTIVDEELKNFLSSSLTEQLEELERWVEEEKVWITENGELAKQGHNKALNKVIDHIREQKEIIKKQ